MASRRAGKTDTRDEVGCKAAEWIFVSYRRADSGGRAQSVCLELETRYVDPLGRAHESSTAGPARRVLRGGSWIRGAHRCRSAYRSDSVGSRLARGSC